MPRAQVFFSYNHQDQKAAILLAKELREAGHEVFLDLDDLPAGLTYFDRLEQGIKGAACAAVLVGPVGLGNFQKRELQVALNWQIEQEGRGEHYPVLPVLLPRCVPQSLPAFLALNTWVDLSAGLEGKGLIASGIEEALLAGAKEPASAPADVVCPYRSLESFREEDAHLFFGRESVSQLALQTALSKPIVTLIGPSGSGKSSLLQAGLFPRLRLRRPAEGTWECLRVTPGDDPFFRLARAIVSLWSEPERTPTEILEESIKLGALLEGDPGNLAQAVALLGERLAAQRPSRLLLAVDQFEELFTRTEGRRRGLFVESLLEASNEKSVTVALVLRADFLGHVIEAHRDFSQVLADGDVPVGPLTSDELQETIEGPARRVRIPLEPGLTGRILGDLGEEPGVLPLLQYCLAEMWKQRRGGALTLATYEAVDGVKGAIGARADHVLGRLSSDEKATLGHALTRLVRVATTGEGSGDTRRAALWSDFAPAQRTLLHSLVDERLLVARGDEEGAAAPPREEAAARPVDGGAVTSHGIVELAHESLLRHWRWLQELVEKDREFLLWTQRLRFFMSEWKRAGEKGPPLFSDLMLNDAKRYSRRVGEDLSPEERRYLDASLGSRRRARQRLWYGAAAVAAVAVAFFGLRLWSGTVGQQIHEAQRDARRIIQSTPDVDVGTIGRWLGAEAALDPEGAMRTFATSLSVTQRPWGADAFVRDLLSAGDTVRARRVFTILEEDLRRYTTPKARCQQALTFLRNLEEISPRGAMQGIARAGLESAFAIPDPWDRGDALASMANALRAQGDRRSAEVAADSAYAALPIALGGGPASTGGLRWQAERDTADYLIHLAGALRGSGRDTLADEMAPLVVDALGRVNSLRVRMREIDAVGGTPQRPNALSPRDLNRCLEDFEKQVAADGVGRLSSDERQSLYQWFGGHGRMDLAIALASSPATRAEREVEVLYMFDPYLRTRGQDEALRLARRLRDPTCRGYALMMVGASVCEMGNFRGGRVLLEEALGVAAKIPRGEDRSNIVTQALPLLADAGLKALEGGDRVAAERIADELLAASVDVSETQAQAGRGGGILKSEAELLARTNRLAQGMASGYLDRQSGFWLRGTDEYLVRLYASRGSWDSALAIPARVPPEFRWRRPRLLRSLAMMADSLGRQDIQGRALAAIAQEGAEGGGQAGESVALLDVLPVDDSVSVMKISPRRVDSLWSQARRTGGGDAMLAMRVSRYYAWRGNFGTALGVARSCEDRGERLRIYADLVTLYLRSRGRRAPELPTPEAVGL